MVKPESFSTEDSESFKYLVYRRKVNWLLWTDAMLDLDSVLSAAL